MFNLCLCLSTFNDVLRFSLGRKKPHISMQMSRQTQTNVLVLWITTYHTQPGAQIIPTSKQICPSRPCSSLILFSLLPRLFMQTVLFRPRSYPAHIVRWRPVQCSNGTRLLWRLKRCVSIQIKRD